MSDLVAFLRARVDEDGKRVARGGRRSMPRHPRALREVEAKRAIIAGYALVSKDDGPGEPEYAYGWAEGLGMAVRALAAVYRDHPDYDPAWAPET